MVLLSWFGHIVVYTSISAVTTNGTEVVQGLVSYIHPKEVEIFNPEETGVPLANSLESASFRLLLYDVHDSIFSDVNVRVLLLVGLLGSEHAPSVTYSLRL
jgi:hypothetical protein